MKAFIDIFLLICLVISIISCNTDKLINSEDEEVWRLGWRMTENSVDEKYKTGELQFDSLLIVSDRIDRKFLISGLEIKSKLNKTKEVTELLNRQDEEILSDLCQQKFLKGLTPCFGLPKENPKNKQLQLELVKMYINDQYIRLNLMNNLLEKYNLIKSEVIIDSFGINTDERNEDGLKEIIKEFQFPTKELVGKDGMEAVFNIIQHSEKGWQNSQLINVEKAVRNGDMDGANYAFLYDRIKVLNGEKQLYGTQVSKIEPINQTVQLFDTEDLENLDKRRREVGMMPIEMYKRIALKDN